MKTKFYITFAAEFEAAPGGGKRVSRIKPEVMHHYQPANRTGVPIEFNVDIPEELFLGRQVSVDIVITPPVAPTTKVDATPGSAWEAMLKKNDA